MTWLELYFVGVLFLFGLLVGSFLNVVIVRLPRDESVVAPRSRCMQCGRTLSWYENVPVLSWLLLRGKCRTCHARISPRYALVELLTAVLFLACWKQFGWGWPLTSALVLVSLLIPLVFIDAELWILPYELTLPGIAVGVLLGLQAGWEGVKGALFGAAAAFLVFRLLELLGFLVLRKETLGAGDKFLLAMVGAFLGYRPLAAVVFLSAVQGGLFGVGMLVLTGRAGPAAPQEEEDPAGGGAAPDAAAEEPVSTFTPAFLAPGLSFGRRLLLFPYTLFLQPIPDEPELEEGQEEEEVWVPGPTNMPFGPWIGLAALEVLLLRPWLAAHLQPSNWTLSLELLFGL